MSMKVADDTLQLARVSVRSLTTSRWKRCISSKTLEDVLVCGGGGGGIYVLTQSRYPDAPLTP